MRLAKMFRMYVQFYELDQAEVAKELDMSVSALSRFLTGETKPRPATMDRIMAWCMQERRAEKPQPVVYLYKEPGQRSENALPLDQVPKGLPGVVKARHRRGSTPKKKKPNDPLP